MSASGGGNRGGGKWDKSKDRVLATFKAKGDREGVLIELISYDGNSPRVRMTRYYLHEKSGEWRADLGDKAKFPRFSIDLYKWLIRATGEIDKGYETWKAQAQKGRPAQDRADDDIPF